MTFKTKIGLLEHLPGMHYIEIPSDIVQKLGGVFNLRLVCTVNKLLSFQCGLVALGKGKAYITITKKRMDILKLKIKSLIQVELKKDENIFGTTFPEEVLTYFANDPEAQDRFEKLTLGKQRTILQYVNAVKNPELRFERAALLFENLKHLPKGKETFREMLGLSRIRPKK